MARGATRAAEALPCLGAHQRGPKPWVLVGFRAPILVDAGLAQHKEVGGRDSGSLRATGPLPWSRQ